MVDNIWYYKKQISLNFRLQFATIDPTASKLKFSKE